MGTKRNPDYLSGFIVPWNWSTTLAADHVSTDYTEAERQPGAATSTTSARLTLDAAGTPDDALAQVYAQVIRGGTPGPDGCGVVYRADTADTWKGAERAHVLTGYQNISTFGYRSADVVDIGGGEAVAVAYYTTTAAGLTLVNIGAFNRGTDGAWSTVESVDTYALSSSPSSVVGAGLTIGPDGGILLYVRKSDDLGASWYVACYRRDVDASTWYEQSRTGITATASTRAIRATTLASGQVVVWTMTGSTTSTACAQWVSYDGGASFVSVGSDARAAVWASCRSGGRTLLLIEDYDPGSADEYHIVSLGDGTIQATGVTPIVTLRASAATPYTSGGALARDESGAVWCYVFAANDVKGFHSVDYGDTWSTFPALEAQGSVASPANGAAVCMRGEVVVVAGEWDGTSPEDGLREWRFGGRSDVTFSADVGFNGYSLIAWTPAGTLTAAGWTATDSGGTRTLSGATGERWVTSVGESIDSTYSIASGNRSGYAAWTLHPVAGTTTLTHVAIGTVQLSVTIEVTSTQIRAYESGGAGGAWTTHGISDYIEVRCVIDDSSADASIFFRALGTSGEREWTELTVSNMTDATGSTSEHGMAVGASSEVYILMAGLGVAQGSRWAGGITRPDDLAGVRLGVEQPTYLTGGLSVFGRGGLGVKDGGTYTIPVTSLYRKDAMLPQVQPSPARGWRSGDASGDLDLRFTLDAENSAAVNTGSDVWGIYLDKLVGVPTLNVYSGTGAGTLIASIDLREEMNFTRSGGSVVPQASGGTAAGPWVAHDELVGGYFEFPNGDVRRIAANSAGALTSGSTIAENRATLYLEGMDGGEDASGTGYVWPPRALLLWYLRGSRTLTQVRLRMTSTSPIGPEAYRGIGVLAMGPVRVMGRPWDRAEALELDPGDEIVTMPDGTRTRSTRVGQRRRIEVAIVESWVSTADVRSLLASPDYVTASAHASATATADRFGDALSLEGLARQVRRSPIVYLPHVPIESGSGAALVAYPWRWAQGAIYGRLTSSARREQIQVGQTITDDGHRVATVPFEEEL